MVDSWGWRIPFLIGVTVGIVGLYIRRYLVEETCYTKAPARSCIAGARGLHRVAHNSSPDRTGSRGRGRLLHVLYLYDHISPANRPYCPIDGARHQHDCDGGVAAAIGACRCIVRPRWPEARFLFATGGMFLMAWPLFWMLHHNSPLVILSGQIGFAVLSASFWGTIPSTMVELVPARVAARCCHSATTQAWRSLAG